MLYHKLTKCVGNTPLLKWNDIYLKMEGMNPSGSIKDRPASFMLEKLTDAGIIKPKDHIVVATGGNMGISISYFASMMDLKVTIVSTNSLKKEFRKRIKNLNASLILTNKKKGIKGAIYKAKKIAKKHNYYYLDQFETSLNKISNYQTYQEIKKDLEDVDFIVCAIGSGGTYLGLLEMIERTQSKVSLKGVVPLNSLALNKNFKKIRNKQKTIPGLIDNYISLNLFEKLQNNEFLEKINPDIIFAYFKKIKAKGLNIGMSGASCLYVCEKLKKENPKAKIVAIIADTYDRYEGFFK